MPVAAAGKVPMYFWEVVVWPFWDLSLARKKKLERARNRQGVGRLVLRAAHTTISHFFFFFLVICRPARKKNQPSLEMYFRILSCSVGHRDRYMAAWYLRDDTIRETGGGFSFSFLECKIHTCNSIRYSYLLFGVHWSFAAPSPAADGISSASPGPGSSVNRRSLLKPVLFLFLLPWTLLFLFLFLLFLLLLLLLLLLLSLLTGLHVGVAFPPTENTRSCSVAVLLGRVLSNRL